MSKTAHGHGLCHRFPADFFGELADDHFEGDAVKVVVGGGIHGLFYRALGVFEGRISLANITFQYRQ